MKDRARRDPLRPQPVRQRSHKHDRKWWPEFLRQSPPYSPEPAIRVPEPAEPFDDSQIPSGVGSCISRYKPEFITRFSMPARSRLNASVF